MQIKYIDSDRELKVLVKELINTNLHNVSCVGMDTEGTGLDPHSNKIRLIQIAITQELVYIIDLFKINKEVYLICLKRIIALFKQYKTVVIWQNFKYDLQMFWGIGIDWYRVNLFDTMLAAQMLDAGLDVKYNLQDIAGRYLYSYVDKAEQRSDWSKELTKEQIEYAALDAVLMIKLYRVLDKKLKEVTNNGTTLEAVFDLEMKAIFPIASMEYYGLRLDVDRLVNHAKPEYEALLEKAEQTFLELMPTRYARYNILGELVDKGIDLNSNSQILEVLQEIGIPNPNPDIDAKLIQSTARTTVGLVDLVEYAIVYALLDHRGASKLLNGYVNALPNTINPITNRIHASFRQSINTGRVAISSPNLQQIPRPKPNQQYTIRSCFVHESGYIYALADYSQVELRVIAEVIHQATGCDVMLREFLDGKDPYANTAALLSGMSYEDFCKLEKSEYKSRRQSAKAVRLGFNYCMGAKKFKNYAKLNYSVTMSQKQADENRKTYFNAYPGLQKYHYMFKDKSILEAYTLPPFNRRRLWEVYEGAGALVNQGIQGTSADITKVAMYYLFDELYNKGYHPAASHDIKLVLQVHDEIILEAKEHLGEYALHILEKYMIQAGQEIIKSCPILADGNLVHSLAEKN